MTAGPYPIPGATMPTWLVRFDKEGVCTSPATRAALLSFLQAEPHTDVLFYAHGWNTDFNGAVSQYSAFLNAFQTVTNDHPPKPDFKPIFVGITWPSVWIPGAKGPDLAAASGGGAPSEAELLQHRRDEIAEQLPADLRARFYELTDLASLIPDQTRELAAITAPLFSPRFEDLAETAPDLDADDVIALANALGFAEGADLGDLDDVGVVTDEGLGDLSAAGAFNPFKIVRLLSVYQMKDRAGLVGARGVASLMADLLSASPGPVHAFGHSFGAKVMLSATCKASLPRPLDSLLLLQPALSHLALAPAGQIEGRPGPGGYHDALTRVRQPILTTYSRKDFPLHDAFHFGLRRAADLGELRAAPAGAGAGEPPDRFAALGGYGPRRSGEQLIHPMPGPNQAWPELEKRLIGLDGSNNQINSHGDVANPYTAWALRSLIAGL